MTAEELMTIAQIGKGTDMTSYEHFAMAEKSAKRPSGVGIAGLTVGGAALLVGIGAWIYAGTYANAKARGNERAIDILANHAMQERAERVSSQQNGTPGIVDIIRIMNNAQSGAGAGAGASALATAEAQALAAILAGNSGRNGQVCPQPVALYQPAMPCSCPGSCNG